MAWMPLSFDDVQSQKQHALTQDYDTATTQHADLDSIAIHPTDSVTPHIVLRTACGFSCFLCKASSTAFNFGTMLAQWRIRAIDLRTLFEWSNAKKRGAACSVGTPLY